ncbi:MAG: hypothetical protein AB1779_05895 [Candidatus Thermoplasmatota archaeon]
MKLPILLIFFFVFFCFCLFVKGEFDHFSLKADEKILAGKSFNLEVRAENKSNETINYLGKIMFFTNATPSKNGFKPIIPNSYEFRNEDKGSKNFTLVFYNAEFAGIVVSSANASANITLNVRPNKVTNFILDAKKMLIAGEEFDVKVFAVDSWLNLNEKYFGGVELLGNAGNSPYGFEPNYGNPYHIFSSNDYGIHVFTGIKFYKSEENVRIEVRDINNQSICGRIENIKVIPANISKFFVAPEANVIAGNEFFVRVAPTDAFGNIIENYTTELEFNTTSKDSRQIYPKKATISLENRGTLILGGFIFYKAEKVVIMVRDKNGYIGYTVRFDVLHSKATKIRIDGEKKQIAGREFYLNFSYSDEWENIFYEKRDVSIEGNASTSEYGHIPYYGNATDNYKILLYKAEKVLITAYGNGVYGSIEIDVISSKPKKILFNYTSALAGIPFILVRKIIDEYGNEVGNYEGEVMLESNATDWYFVAEDRNFCLTFYKAGDFSIYGKGKDGIEGSCVLTIAPNLPAKFFLSMPKSASSSSKFRVEVSAIDEYGNNANFIGIAELWVEDDIKFEKRSLFFYPNENGKKILELELYKAGNVSVIVASEKIIGKGRIEIKDEMPPTKIDIKIKKYGKSYFVFWSKNNDKDFERYEVYENGKKIIAIYERDSTTCIAMPGKNYKVKVFDINGNKYEAYCKVEEEKDYFFFLLIIVVSIIVILFLVYIKYKWL